jgi:hypothetical protein
MPVLSDIPVHAMTQADFLALLDRILPEDYLAPLKDPGPGYEILQAFAAQFARVSQANEAAGRDAQIITAASGAKASGVVLLSRPSPHPDGLTVTVKAGSVVTTSVGGRDFVTSAPVTFAPADLGPFSVGVVAVSIGYEWNVRGETVTAAGDVIPGDIDTVKVLLETPDYGDITIRVSQVAPTVGGTDAALDALGADRGVTRQTGESDTAYRGRLRSLPDTVSPDALRRTIDSILGPAGVAYDFIETFEQQYQECYDAPSTPIPGSPFDPNLFTYDDPRYPEPFKNRWLDDSDFRGAVVIVVDGQNPALYKGLYETLQAIKPAGARIVLELRGQ